MKLSGFGNATLIEQNSTSWAQLALSCCFVCGLLLCATW